MCYVAAGIIGQPDGSEDIVQQAFAIGVEKDLKFESEPQLVAWLAGVVRRCALNDRRKYQRRKTTATDPVILTNVESGHADTERRNRDAIHLSEDQMSFDDEVVHALKQLTPESRACLLLRTIEQLSYKEISELMEVPEGTALSMVHRSRKKLRELLANRDSSSRNNEKVEDNG